jgi:hypothetical protein
MKRWILDWGWVILFVISGLLLGSAVSDLIGRHVHAQAQPAAVASRNVDLEDCSAILFTHADTSVVVSIQLNKSDVRIEHPGIAVCLK